MLFYNTWFKGIEQKKKSPSYQNFYIFILVQFYTE